MNCENRPTSNTQCSFRLMSLWLARGVLQPGLLLGCFYFSELILLYLSGIVLCLQKFLELAKQVGEFITWKQVECPFEQDPNIIHYLHTAPIFTEDGKALYNQYVSSSILINTLICASVISVSPASPGSFLAFLSRSLFLPVYQPVFANRTF